jgi:hypothetical protein
MIVPLACAAAATKSLLGVHPARPAMIQPMPMIAIAATCSAKRFGPLTRLMSRPSVLRQSV